jgi:pimeloyl-ACP methyl ester carboxylesterase
MPPRACEPQHHELFEALQALDLREFQNRQQVETALAPRIPELAIRKFLLKNLARDPHGTLHWRFNLPALHQNYPSLNTAVSAGRPFDRPSLFVRGGQSNYIRDEDLPAIERLFPRAQHCAVPGAGHWVHADAPEILVPIVRNFLAQNS